MSHSRDLLGHIAQLHDIRDIMNSMKNLAFIETRKLERFLQAQQQVVANVETAASDFLAYYPYPLEADNTHVRTLILIGSERGFCGDFNEKLLQALCTAAEPPASAASRGIAEVIGVGRKLCSRLQQNHPAALLLTGANVTEEIPAVLSRLLEEINKLQSLHAALSVNVLYHDARNQQVHSAALLPPFQHCASAAKGSGYPPLLTLAPAELLHELTEFYLFAVLHQIFYTSLMAENYRRLQHMQGAIQHLDERCETLKRNYNTLRQEEITEELEVILMTAESLDGEALHRGANKI